MSVNIKISFVNGLSFDEFKKDVFDIHKLYEEFEIINDDKDPDIIIFGPYGNDLPPKGKYIRIGYFCENFIPDMSICEWGFGTQPENRVKHPKYFRIQWHGVNPYNLIKDKSYDLIKILESKSRFCNFLFSNKVPYREYFFKQLNKYKKVDAPGKSMNNMPSFDSQYSGSFWERKRKFISQYKFTIALENYQYPGYQTEKLYDPMQSNSIPIYCGDPNINEVFNTKSFINITDYYPQTKFNFYSNIETLFQPDLKDIRFRDYTSLPYKIRRKVKAIGRNIKMKNLVNKKVIDNVIENIVELDKNNNKYIKILAEPWLNNNKVKLLNESRDRWTTIFKDAIKKDND